jgi:hypothetical protein
MDEKSFIILGPERVLKDYHEKCQKISPADCEST